MKEEIFGYIKAHPLSTHHDIARGLKIDEVTALQVINQLCTEHSIEMIVHPLESPEDTDSCFYQVRGLLKTEE